MSRAAAAVAVEPVSELKPDEMPPVVRPAGYRILYGLPSPRKALPRRKSAVGTVRRARVHTRTHRLASGDADYPFIRLSGRWLDDAGFLQGQAYEVEVSEGKLVLRTV